MFFNTRYPKVVRFTTKSNYNIVIVVASLFSDNLFVIFIKTDNSISYKAHIFTFSQKFLEVILNCCEWHTSCCNFMKLRHRCMITVFVNQSDVSIRFKLFRKLTCCMNPSNTTTDDYDFFLSHLKSVSY